MRRQERVRALHAVREAAAQWVSEEADEDVGNEVVSKRAGHVERLKQYVHDSYRLDREAGAETPMPDPRDRKIASWLQSSDPLGATMEEWGTGQESPGAGDNRSRAGRGERGTAAGQPRR